MPANPDDVRFDPWPWESPRKSWCTVGWHAWTGWVRECARAVEGETVVCSFRQWRWCEACGAGRGSKELFDVWKLPPDRALALDFLTEDEYARLHEGPLRGVINVGNRMDITDSSWLDANVVFRARDRRQGLRCRFGFHHYAWPPRGLLGPVFLRDGRGSPLQLCCERCRHVGHVRGPVPPWNPKEHLDLFT